MQKYLLKFGSRAECMDYLTHLKELGSDKILFYYLTNGSSDIPLFAVETDEECAVEINAAFMDGPPNDFLDRVELFTGFDPNNI